MFRGVPLPAFALEEKPAGWNVLLSVFVRTVNFNHSH